MVRHIITRRNIKWNNSEHLFRVYNLCICFITVLFFCLLNICLSVALDRHLLTPLVQIYCFCYIQIHIATSLHPAWQKWWARGACRNTINTLWLRLFVCGTSSNYHNTGSQNRYCSKEFENVFHSVCKTVKYIDSVTQQQNSLPIPLDISIDFHFSLNKKTESD